MATVQNLILDSALRKLGVENPSQSERSNALAALNAMLASWGADEFLIYSVTRENFTLTINDAEYSIGSGGDFSTVRPVNIVGAYLRDGTTDYPLKIRNLSEYNSISEKADNGRPCKLFYLPEYPLGVILFDLEPDKAYVLYLNSLKRISSFALTSTPVSLPEEYERALIFNLAVEIASEHDVEVSPEVFSIASTTKNDIIELNASVRMIEPVQADAALTWPLLK